MSAFTESTTELARFEAGGRGTSSTLPITVARGRTRLVEIGSMRSRPCLVGLERIGPAGVVKRLGYYVTGCSRRLFMQERFEEALLPWCRRR